MAQSRKLSKNRMLLELIENGIDAEKRKQQQFFALAERCRNEQIPKRPTAWARDLAEWSSAADAATRVLGQPACGGRRHLVGRMRDRKISVSDLNELRLWVETRPEVFEGDWYKAFGSFKVCGSGSYPKTFLLRGQVAKGEAL